MARKTNPDRYSIKIGGATVRLNRAGYYPDNRAIYYWTIILPDGSRHAGNDLKSGCGNDEGAKKMMSTILAFLGACAESLDYRERNGISLEPMQGTPLEKFQRDDNLHLFPLPVARWASEHDDEISMKCEEIYPGN